MKANWIHINGYKELPEGEWLVAERSRRDGRTVKHVASMNANGVAIVGGAFAFDRGTIFAYCKLPEDPADEK